ncbi:hypothetical protein [Soonwooa sp.]|uniref:hypothetical protein n=1 Tax=Soonwooa sp. TaxID=1938592 RepID=UPI00260EDAE3|nr:hypothetical protein [Soonwooa sp.]
MQNPIKVEAYNFKPIIKYSIIAALVSCCLIFVIPNFVRFLSELFAGIIIVGIPYGFFVQKIKKNEETLEVSFDEISINNKNLNPHDIGSYRIMNALRLYFILRINLKNGEQIVYYLPETAKENIRTFFNKNDIKESHLNIDFFIKNYLFIYVLAYVVVIGFSYYFGQQLYYFLKFNLFI